MSDVMQRVLLTESSDDWLCAVLADFDAFLLDHAANERKASSMAMTFVLRYPDRDAILEPMIQLAREELAHFHRVFRIVRARGLRFERDERDLYMKHMLRFVRDGRDAEFLDRLLLASVVEARGCERFRRVAESISEPELAAFYSEIASSEARHHELFLELARVYFDASIVIDRLREWSVHEAETIASLPPRARLH